MLNSAQQGTCGFPGKTGDAIRHYKLNYSRMKKLVILTGAGMSAESGIKTFRDSGGLWEQYNVEEVASIDGWYRNPDLV